MILFFMNSYVDVFNYNNPYNKYLHKITNALFANSFTVNNLNFNPSIVSNNYGAFVNYKYYQNGFQFSQNEKTTSSNSNNTHIMVCFYFWMQNIKLYYERYYESLQDLLSNIGGIESFMRLIATIINSLIVNYIILLDTEELVLNTDKINFKKVNINSKPTFLKKASQLFNPPKKILSLKNNIPRNKISNIQNKNQSSIAQILLKDKTDIWKLSNKLNKDSKSEPFKSIDNYLIQKKTDKKSNNSLLIKDFTGNYNKRENTGKNNDNSDSNSISLRMSNKESLKVLETKNNEEIIKPLTKQNFSWFNYIFYIIPGCKNPKISYYENFRKEIISEENIIQNHINIFKLLKVCNIENHDPFSIKPVNNVIC